MTDLRNFGDLFHRVFSVSLPDYDTPENAKKFTVLTRILLEANEKMDLTAVTDPEQILVRHYVDCAFPASLFPAEARVADIGAGAGFPTLPLAILRPDLTLVAVDSTEKRMRYVEQAARELGLRVETVTGRAEELGKDPIFREQFDAVTARAVARLNLLSELCLPFCRVGGNFIALKGVSGEEELREAAPGIALLGGRVADTVCFTLPELSDGAEKRVAVRVEKISPTPEKYPRRFARIKSDPLK